MERERFLHELKEIVTIQKALKWNIERISQIEERLVERTNKLLDEVNEESQG